MGEGAYVLGGGTRNLQQVPISGGYKLMPPNMYLEVLKCSNFDSLVLLMILTAQCYQIIIHIK